MAVIKNPKDYDTKEPTNIRLEPDLKKKMWQEVEESGGRLTLSDIVNEEVRKRYE